MQYTCLLRVFKMYRTFASSPHFNSGDSFACASFKMFWHVIFQKNIKMYCILIIMFQIAQTSQFTVASIITFHQLEAKGERACLMLPYQYNVPLGLFSLRSLRLGSTHANKVSNYIIELLLLRL